MISKLGAALAVMFAASSAHATITFDGVGLQNGTVVTTAPTNVGDGFSLRSANTGDSIGSYIISSNDGTSGQNSTLRYLSAHDTQKDTSTILFRLDDAPFTLTSFDYHGWNNNYAKSVTLTGTFAGGGPTITQTFDLTKTFSQPFQTAVLSSGWTGLNSVTFHGDLRGGVAVYALDNIVVSAVSAVPEPSAWLMLLVGFAGIGVMTRRRSSLAGRARLA